MQEKNGLGFVQVHLGADFLFYFFLIFTGVLLLYNVVFVSTIQESESVMRIHISPLFWISFPLRSPQSLPCATVSSHQLSILSIYIVSVVCICRLSVFLLAIKLPPEKEVMAFFIFQKFLLLALGRLLSASVGSDSHLPPDHNNNHAKPAYFGVTASGSTS